MGVCKVSKLSKQQYTNSVNLSRFQIVTFFVKPSARTKWKNFEACSQKLSKIGENVENWKRVCPKRHPRCVEYA